MTPKLTPARILAAAVLALAGWIVHGFLDAVLTACVIVIASWPLYAAFQSWPPARARRHGGAVVFTAAITVFLLAPMVFACWALLSESRTMLHGLAIVNGQGLALPAWLADTPWIGPWITARWQQQPHRPGALLELTQHADPGTLLGWVQSLGLFTFRQALIVGFTILLLVFLYQEGATLSHKLTQALRQAVGERADHYVQVGTRAVRASVNSMLAVALYDGLASALAYAAAGAPRPMLWAGITGALAAVPFLGYAAVAALALQLALQGAAAAALLSLVLGGMVLLSGDKLVRPLVARGGLQLPFVWVLMGCIGGFEVLGLMGLVIGPAVLSVANELWAQHMRDTTPG